MKNPYAKLILVSTLILAGCESNHDPIMPGKPTPPPSFPRPVVTPIDPALQASARAELQAGLNSSDELLRAHSLEILKDLHLPGTDQQIVGKLRDPSALVRKSAAFASGELRIKSAELILPELLASEASASDPVSAEQERMAGIFALHRLGNTQFSHEFEKTAIDPRSHVRAETAVIFGLLGEPSAIPILVEMLNKDTDGNVRMEAGEALWRLGDERGEDALLAATVSAYASDQMIALLALAQRHDTRVLGHVEGLLNSEYLEVSLVAARASGMLGSQDGYGVAMKGQESADPRQRALAAWAFGAIGRSDAQLRLAKLLKDQDPDVRLAAAGALVQIAEKAGA